MSGDARPARTATLLLLTAYLISTPVAVFCILWSTLLGRWEPQQRVNQAVRLGWGRCLMLVLWPWCRFSMENTSILPPPGKRFIMIANHQSHLDMMMMSLVTRNFRFLAKKEMLSVPYIGWVMRAMGDVSVDRESREDRGRAMESLLRVLDKGVGLVIYPEGTRRPSAQATELMAFKKGAFVLAFETDTPVVVMGIHGTERILPKGSSLLFPGGAVGRILGILDRKDFSSPEQMADAARCMIQTFLDFRNGGAEARARVRNILAPGGDITGQAARDGGASS